MSASSYPATLWQIADVAVYCRGPAAGGQRLFVAAFMPVHRTHGLVEDGLVLPSAYLLEDLQRLRVDGKSVVIAAVKQVHLSEIIEHLRFPAAVADPPVPLERMVQLLTCLAVAPEVPAGDSGMAQGVGDPPRVGRRGVQH